MYTGTQCFTLCGFMASWIWSSFGVLVVNVKTTLNWRNLNWIGFKTTRVLRQALSFVHAENRFSRMFNQEKWVQIPRARSAERDKGVQLCTLELLVCRFVQCGPQILGNRSRLESNKWNIYCARALFVEYLFTLLPEVYVRHSSTSLLFLNKSGSASLGREAKNKSLSLLRRVHWANKRPRNRANTA